jgi:hypothetical protein
MTPDEERLMCDRCGEIGEIHTDPGGFFVSCQGNETVRSRIKLTGICCQTAMHQTKEAAVAAWEQLTGGDNSAL